MAGTRDALDSLAPWDAIPYFRAVKETAITVPAGVTTPIVAADPMRVALIMSGSAVGTATISMDPNTTGVFGLPIGQTILPITLLFAETGPLCQQAWFCRNMGQLTVTVYEVILARWPRADAARKGGRRAPTS